MYPAPLLGPFIDIQENRCLSANLFMIRPGPIDVMESRMRPILIFLFSLLAVVSCDSINQAPRDEAIDTPDLIGMLKNGDFDGITRLIEDYQKIYESDPARELHAVVPYRQFIDASYLHEEKSMIEAQLEAWEHHSTDSFAPYMAMCSYSYGIASQKHGTAKTAAISDMRVHCSHALKLNPKLPYAYGRLIKAGRMDGNREEVDKWLRRGLTALPASYFVRSAYYSILSPKHGGSNEEMLGFANQAQEHVDSNPMLVRLLGDAHDKIGSQHMRRDDYQKAIASYKKSLQYYTWPNPLISMAAAYTSTGENDLAIDALTQAIELHGSLYTYMRRARAYSDAGRFDEAMADIDFALEDEPDNSQFIRQKANIYYKMEQYADALAGYERLVTMGRANAWDWRRIAYIKQRKIIDIPAAEESYLRALALEPDNDWAWHEYATLLYNKKDKRAPAAFQTYLELCSVKKGCDPVMVTRSKKFLDCVNGKPECVLETAEYSYWVPGA